MQFDNFVLNGSSSWLISSEEKFVFWNISTYIKNNLFITLEGQQWINSLLYFLFISSNPHSAPTKDNQGFAIEWNKSRMRPYGSC